MITFKILVHLTSNENYGIKEIWGDFKNKNQAIKWVKNIYKDYKSEGINVSKIEVINPLE